MSVEFDYLLKFIIIGESGVGKSNILSKFRDNIFDEKTQPSIGVQFIAKNLSFNNLIFRLQIWDTAGQESFRSMTKVYYKNSSCAFIVYDITEKRSFYNLETWLNECKSVAPETIVFVLIGNKSDIIDSREVTYEEGANFAKDHNMLFFETSAKNGDNIEKIFKESLELIYKNIEDGKYDLTDDSCGIKICKSEKNINLSEYEYESTKVNIKKKKNKCC